VRGHTDHPVSLLGLGLLVRLKVRKVLAWHGTISHRPTLHVGLHRLDDCWYCDRAVFNPELYALRRRPNTTRNVIRLAHCPFLWRMARLSWLSAEQATDVAA